MNNSFSELVRTLKRLERQQRRQSRFVPSYSVEVQTNYVIAGGIVTLTGYSQIRLLVIDTEGAAATDDLDTISGGVNGDIIVCRKLDNARHVVFKDVTGNMRLAGDFTLNQIDDTITMIYYGTNWHEISRSDNA